MFEIIIYCTMNMFGGNNTVKIATNCSNIFIEGNTTSVISCDHDAEIVVPSNLCSVTKRRIK